MNLKKLIVLLIGMVIASPMFAVTQQQVDRLYDAAAKGKVADVWTALSVASREDLSALLLAPVSETGQSLGVSLKVYCKNQEAVPSAWIIAFFVLKNGLLSDDIFNQNWNVYKGTFSSDLCPVNGIVGHLFYMAHNSPSKFWQYSARYMLSDARIPEAVKNIVQENAAK